MTTTRSLVISSLLRSRPLSRLNAYGADFELGHLAHRVQSRVGQPVRAAFFAPVEGDEDGVFANRGSDADGEAGFAASGCQRHPVAIREAMATGEARVHFGQRRRGDVHQLLDAAGLIPRLVV